MLSLEQRIQILKNLPEGSEVFYSIWELSAKFSTKCIKVKDWDDEMEIQPVSEDFPRFARYQCLYSPVLEVVEKLMDDNDLSIGQSNQIGR